MRERWTDDRMDDLNAKVDTLRGEMKAEFADVRTEMRTEFKAVRREMKTEFSAVRAEMKIEHDRAEDRAEAMMDRLLSIQRQMLLFSTVAIGALIGVIAALGAVATQL